MKTLVSVMFVALLCLNLSFAQNQSMQFDTTGQYLEVGNPAELSFDLETSFTLECWIKTDSHGPNDGYGVIISKTDTTPFRRGYELGIEDGDPIFIMSHRYGTNYFELYPAGVDLNDGQWHHIAMAYRARLGGTQVITYVDGLGSGKIVACGSCLTDSITNDVPLTIGSRIGKEGFKGLIDEVRIWDDTRFSGQINSNWDTELDGTEFQLLANYKFDNDSSDCVFDCTANEFHAQRMALAGGPGILPSFSTDVPPITEVACVNTPAFDCFVNASLESISTIRFGVYPNPTSNLLHLDLPISIRVESVKAYDLLGREFTLDYQAGTPLQIDHLATGKYQLVLQGQDELYTSSFIVQ